MSQEKEELIRKVKGIIVESLELDIDPADIEDDEVLFGGQYDLDSFSTLVLIAALEEAFGIEVEDDDLTGEFIESVASVAGYIKRRLEQEQAPV